MRIGLIGDVHLHNFRQFDSGWVRDVNEASRGSQVPAGVNSRCILTGGVLCGALEALKAVGADLVYQLGDLFESPTEPPAVLATALHACLGANQGFIPILGNHDASTSPASFADSALAPFAATSLLARPTRPGIRCYDYGTTRAPDRPIDSHEFHHLGLWSEKEPVPDMATAKDACVEALWSLGSVSPMRDCILAAGHWHHARYFGVQNGLHILQAGVLHPTSFADDGWADVGYVYLFDDSIGALQSFSIPGLRFINVHDLWQGILDIRAVYGMGCVPIVAVHAETARDAMKMRDQLFELFGTEAPVGLSEERCVLRVHPAEVAVPKPVQQSREAYAMRAVAKMPLVEGHERGRAMQRILTHWKT